MRKRTPGTFTSFNHARNKLSRGSIPLLNFSRKTPRASGSLYKSKSVVSTQHGFSITPVILFVANSTSLFKLKCFY